MWFYHSLTGFRDNVSTVQNGFLRLSCDPLWGPKWIFEMSKGDNYVLFPFDSKTLHIMPQTFIDWIWHRKSLGRQ